MAVYQNGGAPPPTGILAFNNHSERGWNDPPTLAFATPGASTVTPRKRLDLRKRVAHNCITGTGMNTGMANLSLNQNLPNQNIHGQQNTYYHQPNPTNLPPTIPPINNAVTSSYNLGYQPHPAPGVTLPHGGHVMPGFSTPPPVVHSGPPLASHLIHAASMPNLQQTFQRGQNSPSLPHGSSPLPQSQPPIFNVTMPYKQLDNNEVPAAFAPVRTNINEIPHLGEPLVFPITQPYQQHISTVTTTTNNLVSQVGESTHTTSENELQRGNDQALMNQTMPNLINEHPDHAHHVRRNSLPNITPPRDSPPIIGAPPTSGYYTRKSSSANTSRQGTPSPLPSRKEIFPEHQHQASDDSGILSSVIDQLNFAVDKYMGLLDQKTVNDIHKKIQIFQMQWNENTITEAVKSRMVLLARALSDNKFGEADQIHQSLVVDYSSEVNQWMVGIKKLIVTCQSLELQKSQ